MKEISSLKRHIEESPKLRDLKRRRHRRRVRLMILCALLFLCLLAGFIFASRSSKLLVRQVTVSGNQVTDTKDIVGLIEKHLSGNYVYVVPHRNIFLFPKKKIIADIAETFPRLRDISIKKTSLTSIAVSASEIKGNALWCGVDSEKIDASVPCYFTDGEGVIVARSPYYSGNVYPRFFGSRLPLKKDESPIGQAFLPAQSFAKLLAFSEEITKLGFSVKAIRVGQGDEYALVLDTGNGRSAPVRFLVADDYAVLAANLASALSKKELADQVQGQIGALEYFDLRFTNKVYYKFSP